MTRGGNSAQKLKLSQKLSAHQVQLMQLVSLPYTELSERIKKELEDNPALEEGAEIPDDTTIEGEHEDAGDITEQDMMLGDYANEDEVPDRQLSHYDSSRTPGSEMPNADEPTLVESLMDQLLLTTLTDEEMEIAEFVVGSLDSDGLLRRDNQGLLDDMAIYRGLYPEERNLDEVINTIKTLEPAGIGARSLQECLQIQLTRKPHTPTTDLALKLLGEYFPLFSTKQIDQIISRSGASPEELREASKLITTLNPSPGLDFQSRLESTLRTVIPDFEVTEQGGDLVVTLYHGDMPEVRVSREFEDRLSAYTGDLRKLPQDQRETGKFVKQKIEDAQSFVDLLKMREQTLISTMMTIVDLQRAYFMSGDTRNLRPMILKDVAERTGYDISTISRVTSTKYVSTDFGTYPLKYFFSEGTVNEDGVEISTRRVRELLQQIIDEEDKRSPLSDEALREELKKHGFDVARRTIAKYREQIGIPVARLRKEF